MRFRAPPLLLLAFLCSSGVAGCYGAASSLNSGLSSSFSELFAIVASIFGLLGVGLGFAAYRFEPMLLGAASPSAAVSEVAEPEPEPAPAASASASAPVAETSASAAPNSDETRSCLRSMFPEDSFSADTGASLDFVCSETSGIKAAEAIKKALVNAGSAKASGGMKEWSVLGFYSLASAAVIRGRCCPTAPALTMPATGKPCEAIDEAMTSLATLSLIHI